MKKILFITFFLLSVLITFSQEEPYPTPQENERERQEESERLRGESDAREAFENSMMQSEDDLDNQNFILGLAGLLLKNGGAPKSSESAINDLSKTLESDIKQGRKKEAKLDADKLLKISQNEPI